MTINLVDVACSSEGDENKFWEILEERLNLCHKALRAKHERLLARRQMWRRFNGSTEHLQG